MGLRYFKARYFQGGFLISLGGGAGAAAAAVVDWLISARRTGRR